MIRGIERRRIFRNDADREDFLARLAILLPKTETACYAWVFLPNHAHFLFRSGTIPLATLMRRLLTGYAVNFNRRHNRQGHLFQNRYKSIVCQEDAYLLELVRYIHLNPMRAGILHNFNELNHYVYSGHCALMGRVKHPWQGVDHVLGYFGDTMHKARRNYLAYLKAGSDQGRRDDLRGGGLIRSLGGWAEVRVQDLKAQDHKKSDERILGASDFVADILSRARERFERNCELKRLGYDLDRVVRIVAEICGIEMDDFFLKGKQPIKVKARSLFCFWAVQELKISLTELARYLGISIPAVGYAVVRGEKIARSNKYQLIK